MAARSKCGAPAESPKRAGFALIMTLLLIAFLGALIATFGILAQVEEYVARNSQEQSLARQNALMALNVALGELQRWAGPDRRVTACASPFGAEPAGRRWTGVWGTGEAGNLPLTWLVSRDDETAPSANAPSTPTDPVEMVGHATSGQSGDVVAGRKPVFSKHFPGSSGPVETGHYAWWVGDEGVKASVAIGRRIDDVAYSPYDSSEARARLTQQLAIGAGPADADGASLFEPREAANSPFAERITTFSQLALLASFDGSAVGAEMIRPYFHAWTPRAAAVLADPERGGLRQDLSQDPNLLGPAFAAWCDFATTMENPASPLSPGMTPNYPPVRPQDALRRRYRITAPLASNGITFGIAPVLSYFLLTFNIRTDQSVPGSIRPLEVRARWLVSFWNPYTSALVPEDLELEVANLPALQIVNETDGTTSPAIALDALYGAPLRIALPWTSDGREDRQSWFPGRVHTWAAGEDLNKSSPAPSSGFNSVFYTRTLTSASGQGVQRAVSGPSFPNSATAHIQGTAVQPMVRLYHSGAAGREEVNTFTGPSFAAFNTTPGAINGATYQISYVFRLAESLDQPAAPDAWLTTAGRDPRAPVAASYLSGPNGPRPELYPNYTTISFLDRLLDRSLPASASSHTGQSYNEDVPLFELPRSPVVSLGALQQLFVPGARPFAVGNPWGNSFGVNSWFDRFFFSGVTPSIAASATGAAPLPNFALRFIREFSDEAPKGIADIGNAPSDRGSKFVLQEAAFNVNSIEPLAWLAVLRSGRRLVGDEFKYLSPSVSLGTAADAAILSTSADAGVFFRYPFSAHETFKAEPGFAASSSTPPASPNVPSLANTHLFRRGMRALAPAQTAALAETIASLVATRQAAAGPYRSIEEFLAPDAGFGGASLLECALATATTDEGTHLNDLTLVPEFSSQRLIPGDLMATLAPMLFVRSDTFRLRAYGDRANPVTGAITGRAWAEAIVQRLPSYVDATQDAATAPTDLNPQNRALGRRFKIISFRWLDPADI
ncbi:MAG: hypothetical protein JWM32_60 [Verrucomicrobia bacterium]|nr:hypothetical protein [Verrucomicrobiota bacterium]